MASRTPLEERQQFAVEMDRASAISRHNGGRCICIRH